tara:strand:- start:131 stop:442 length:312 start_codon:yes stop_codon:yes gene_type:complete
MIYTNKTDKEIKSIADDINLAFELLRGHKLNEEMEKTFPPDRKNKKHNIFSIEIEFECSQCGQHECENFHRPEATSIEEHLEYIEWRSSKGSLCWGCYDKQNL